MGLKAVEGHVLTAPPMNKTPFRNGVANFIQNQIRIHWPKMKVSEEERIGQKKCD